MNLSIFGLGYVGTVCAACFSKRGHFVTGIDTADTKVELMKAGQPPIIEAGVAELIRSGVSEGRIRATQDVESSVLQSDLSLVCVGTPSQPNGALSVKAVEAVAGQIGRALRKKAAHHTVVIRSTVVPGTTVDVLAPILEDASGKKIGTDFGLAFNPEFLREGTAVADFNTPSKTVVGSSDERTSDTVMALYEDLPGPKIRTSVELAELAKYIDNAWHALKVAFGNEVGVLAKTLGINSHQLMDIFFEDKRLNISPAYLRPGFAFGGSCLPKDLRALTYLGRRLDLSLPVLENVLVSNRMLVDRGLDWIMSQEKRRVAFLGVSFKSGTDDVRESPFVELIERLVGKGFEVRIFDPNVNLARIMGANKDYLMKVLPHVADLMVAEIADAADWAEVLVLTTPDPTYVAAAKAARADQRILDFAGTSAREKHVNMAGFLW